jgi:PAS domain S-box-containing protein
MAGTSKSMGKRAKAGGAKKVVRSGAGAGSKKTAGRSIQKQGGRKVVEDRLRTLNTQLEERAVERTAELRASEEQYRQLFDLNADAVHVLTPEGWFLDVNRAATERYGYTREEFLTMHIRALSPPKLQDPVTERLKKTLMEGGVFEWVHRRKDGSELPVEIAAASIQYQGETAILATVRDITRRKQAEESLRASEKRHRIFAELTSDFVFVVNFDETGQPALEWMSDSFERITGYSPAEVIARGGPLAYTHPGDLPLLQHDFERILRGETVMRESRMIAADGRVLWLRIYSRPVWDAERGRLKSIYGAGQDITERREMEEALRESEQKYLFLFGTSPTATVLFKLPEAVMVDVNAAAERLFGHTREELLGRTTLELGIVRGVNLEAVQAEFKKEGALIRNSLRIYTKSGEERIIASRTFPLEINGKPHALSTMQDITESRQADEKLRASEQRFRLLVQTLQSGIQELDLEGNILYANEGYHQIYGYKNGELLGKNLSNLILLEEDKQRFQEYWSALVRGQIQSRTFETQVFRSDGRPIWVRSVWEYKRDANGEVTGVIANIIDLTEQKLTEHALRHNQERLRELSRRLAEVQERERLNLANELHDRVGQALSTLNLNLSILRNQFPSTDAIGARLDDSMQLVEETVGHVRDVMADLHPPVLADYGLATALHSQAELFTRRTGIPVRVEEAGEIGDRLPAHLEAALFRVAQEALTNVARHAGARHVTLKLERLIAGMRLVVQDDGLGFDHAALQPERRGLLTMRQRMEAIGGTLTVDSGIGRGTRILADLPSASWTHEEAAS